MGLHVGRQSKSQVRVPVWVIFLVLVMVGNASGHRPLFSGTGATDPASAMPITDPAVSHVIYTELTAEAAYRWFIFENLEVQDVAVQLGVPAGMFREGRKPTVILIGPEWPNRPDQLPIPLPIDEPVGAMEVPQIDTPNRFYEPVTGTESWILVDTHVELTTPGTYYGVVYDANGQKGKVWVSVGQREGFGLRDLPRLPGWIRQVRRFHEVGGWPRWVWIGACGLTAILLFVRWLVVRRGAETRDHE